MGTAAAKLKVVAPWVTIAGVVTLLAGLAWDAILHKLDPELATRESVFSITNPGHVLFGGGMAIVVLGALMYLAGRALEASGRRALLFGGTAAGLVAFAMTSFAIAASTGSLGGPEHVHDNGTVHTDAEHKDFVAGQAKNPASSSLPGVTHDHGEAVAITAQDLEAAAKLVSDVKAGTARLNDFQVARAEGYTPITSGRSGLTHYLNPAYYLDGKNVEPDKPEVLMYARLPGGEQKLVGVMFLMMPGRTGPRVGGPLTAWHAHDNLCYSSTTGIIVALTGADGKCPAGSVFRGVTPEMMHVWVVDNPNGVFSDDMEPAALLKLLASSATKP